MAGLLDSDWVKFLAAPRAYYRDKAAQDSANQFGGLLGTLQEQQGPSQPGQAGLLAARAPDAQFWLKAAQIPGYEGLAGQQLGIEAQGTQAMQRQEQGQGWSLNNMTMAQKAAQQLDELRAAQAHGIAQANLARQWFGTKASATASYASAESSRQSGLLSQLKQTEQANKNAMQGGALYSQLPPAERVKANDEIYNADTWAEGAKDVADWAQKRSTGAALPGVGTSEAATWLGEYQTSVKPMLMKVLNTGVLQGKEGEQLEELMGRPDDYILTKSDLNVINNMAQKAADLRERAYRKYELRAPELQAGKSAAARSLGSGKPSGELAPVTTRPGDSSGGYTRFR